METKIEITENALQELDQIISTDYTLEGLIFRLRIDNKGCDGFTYELGFSEQRPEDITLTLGNDRIQLPLLVDPFTLEYCHNGIIDFTRTDDDEGFIFDNKNQKKFYGKFWTKSSTNK